MTDTPDNHVTTAYRDWLNADPEPGWYDPGEGHRIRTAFTAGWVAGMTHLAAELATCWAADPHLVKLVEDLKMGGDDP